MKTVSVNTKNFELKEKLLIDLATIGYRLQASNNGIPDIIIAGYDEFVDSLLEIDLNTITLVILDVAENGSAVTLSKADEVIIAPYDTEELELRLKLALLRRGAQEKESEGGENVIVADGMVLNDDSYEVTIDGEPLDLTFKEYELLKYLIAKRGRVYTRDQLLSTVWGYDYYGGARTVDVHIRRLRAKLGRYESFIETVRNVGYRFRK